LGNRGRDQSNHWGGREQLSMVAAKWGKKNINDDLRRMRGKELLTSARQEGPGNKKEERGRSTLGRNQIKKTHETKVTGSPGG